MVVLVVLSLSSFAKAQTSFDPEEGCLNVVDVSYSQGIGEYGDGGIAANYLHESSSMIASASEPVLDTAIIRSISSRLFPFTSVRIISF